ncbi:unnamed protein product [Sphagnum jensenii]|uniref:UPF3 domain-containing protein n=1 Tax=Sphagnum jensenii TaxID=128206 RepID=A0ABP0VM90_9BRYO
MKESQARTKVVLRHLPPSLTSSVLHEQILSKYAGTINWFAFHPGKSSHKRQVHSRAYINFKKPEDVIDFYEVFNGHIFVNEKGAQYKALVEYAPHQRVPKPRSKKDVREGTITKDPDYLAFLELLEKPMEHLPSAEVQLERKEAEKAAALAKDSVIVTPLMEFVRQRRAARFSPQRGASATTKIAARASNLGSGTYNLSSQRRSSERSRPGTPTYISENMVPLKEVSHGANPRREEQQRREKEILVDRKKRDTSEGREKKPSRDSAASAPSSFRGNAGNPHIDPFKEHVILLKDSSETLTVAYRATSAGSTATASSTPPKHSHHRESGKSSPRAGSSAKDHAQVASSQHGVTTTQIPTEPKGISQPLLERGGKRPPRPQAIRLAGKDQTVSLVLPLSSASEVESGASQNNNSSRSVDVKEKGSNIAASDGGLSASMSDRQDARRLRNKDRPDRPVWTPRRRSETVAVGSEVSSGNSSAVVPLPISVVSPEASQANLHSGTETVSRAEKEELVNDQKHGGKSGSDGRGSESQQGSGGGHRQGGRHERNGQAPKEGALAISGAELATKPSKRGRAPPVLGANEKQVWVAVQKTVTGS